MTLTHILSLFVVATAVALGVVPIVRGLSLRARLVDEPGGRKVHTTAVPRLGGIGIVAGFAAALVLEVAGELAWGWPRILLGGDGQILGTMLGIAFVFGIGLVDDVRGMKAGVKLGGQIVAALFPVMLGLRIEFFGNPFGEGTLVLGWWSYPLTVLWLVAFANVFNLIDGLDGLAGGIAAISAASFLALAIDMHQAVAAILAVALIGGCLGFLRYNFSPASIYMGDSGSLSIGFILGCISLTGVMKSAAAISLLAPLLIIGVPVFDTASAILRRSLHGRPIHEADNGHIHHRLLHRGFSVRQTVLVIYAWAGMLALGGFAMRPKVLPVWGRAGALVVMVGLSALMAYWLGLLTPARIHGDSVESRVRNRH